MNKRHKKKTNHQSDNFHDWKIDFPWNKSVNCMPNGLWNHQPFLIVYTKQQQRVKKKRRKISVNQYVNSTYNFLIGMKSLFLLVCVLVVDDFNERILCVYDIFPSWMIGVCYRLLLYSFFFHSVFNFQNHNYSLSKSKKPTHTHTHTLICWVIYSFIIVTIRCFIFFMLSPYTWHISCTCSGFYY